LLGFSGRRCEGLSYICEVLEICYCSMRGRMLFFAVLIVCVRILRGGTIWGRNLRLKL
jgi:hypothetical protein